MKKTLDSKIETKYTANYAYLATPNTYLPVNSPILGPTQWTLAVPGLGQGLTAYDRIGDKISPTSLKVALDLRFTAAAQATPHDITAVIYYGYCKKYTSFYDVQSNSVDLCDQLLRLGGVVTTTDAELQPFNGIQSDVHLPINKTVWALKKKTIHMYKAPGILNGGASAGVLSTPNKNNVSVILDWSSALPAKLKYDQSTDVYPENFAPVFAIGYYYNDGTAPDTGTGILEFQASKMLYFKDA